MAFNRTGLVFFAGPANTGMTEDEPWAEALYSFGARQSFVKMFRNQSNVQIFEKHIPDYKEKLSSSIFW